MKSYRMKSPQSQEGAVLIEAMIALLIFSLGVLALAGLQMAMIKNTDDARYRAEATFIAQEKLGQIWANTGSQAALAGYATAAGPENINLPNGLRTVAIDGNQVVTVTVTWQLPGQDQHNYVAQARVEGIY